MINTSDLPKIIDPDTEAMEALAKLCGQTGVKVVVKRKAPDAMSFEWIAEIQSDDLSVEYLASEFGGGEYSCTARNSKGHMTPAVRFEINRELKGRRRIALEKEESKGRGGSDLAPLVQILEKVIEKSGSNNNGSENMNMMMQQMQASQAASTASSMQMMQFMMTGMQESNKLMIAMMQAKGQGGGSDVASLVTSLSPLLLQSANHRGTTTDKSMKENLELIAQIRDLFPANGDSREPSILENLTGLLGEGVAAYMASKGMNPAELATAAEPHNPTKALKPQQQELKTMETTVLELKAEYKNYLPKLIHAADTKSDPTTIAHFICDSMPQNEASVLVQMLVHENWTLIMFDDNPMVIERIEWFSQMRESILEAFGVEIPKQSEEAGISEADKSGLSESGEMPEATLDNDNQPKQEGGT